MMIPFNLLAEARKGGDDDVAACFSIPYSSEARIQIHFHNIHQVYCRTV